MAKRKYDPERLAQAASAWDVHHALVAAVRRLVKLSGGVQEAKDVIDAIAAADAVVDDKEEAQSPRRRDRWRRPAPAGGRRASRGPIGFQDTEGAA
jgi:hypothetical protein